MGKVIAVCVSEQKGTQKKNVGSAQFIEDWGIQGDAHAGKWHRQVSLLSHEQVEAFRARGAVVDDGAFGENLVVEGYDFKALPIGTKFQCSDVVLELTQVGKQCHAHCEIYKVMGDCIMPREGVFTKVLHGGTISVGDEFTIVEEGEYAGCQHHPSRLRLCRSAGGQERPGDPGAGGGGWFRDRTHHPAARRRGAPGL